MQLFDTHCHLDMEAFSEEVEPLLERARARGVTRVATIGCVTDLGSLDTSLQIAAQHPGVVATVGIHPHDARFASPALLAALHSRASEPALVAVGETGLDYHYDRSPRDAQRRAFAAQMRIARDNGKPVILHLREAHDDAMAILADDPPGARGGIVHCFSGTPEEMSAYLAFDFYISFSGIITFPGRSRDPIREAARTCPDDRILVETDAPYLAPVPHRGDRNEPAYVRHTAEALAELREVSLGEIARITTANACRVYGLADG